MAGRHGPNPAAVKGFEAVAALRDLREGARGPRRGREPGGAGCAREVALARGSLSRCRVPDKKAPQAARPGSKFLGNTELAAEDTEVNLCHSSRVRAPNNF